MVITAINVLQQATSQSKFSQPNSIVKRQENTSFGKLLDISSSELSAYGCVALITAGVVDKVLLKGKVLNFCPYLDGILFWGGTIGLVAVMILHEVGLHKPGK